MNINKKIAGNTWVKYDDNTDVEFLLRPVPYSYMKADTETLPEVLAANFDYCVVDWKGLDSDGEVFECNAENKRYLFDYVTPIREFVMLKVSEINKSITEDLKN